MRTRACVAALLVCLGAAAAGTLPAGAQDKDAVTESARRRFQEGVHFFDKGRYEDARAAFLQAYALKRHPAVLLNLAQSELRSLHYVDAARHFSAFLRESTTASAVERSDAEKGLAQARAKLGRIQVTVSGPGANVSVDGESIGESPLPEAVDVAPGTHKVEARQGSRSAASTVSVQTGKVASTTLSLAEGGAPAPAAVSVPGPAQPTAAAETPAASSPAASEGAEPGTSSRPSPPKPSASLSTTASEGPGFFGWVKSSPFAWIGLGVTGVGLTGFTIAGVASRKANSNAESVVEKIHTQQAIDKIPQGANVCGDQSPAIVNMYSNACSILKDNMSRRDTDVTIATVGAIAAGVGVAATVTAYFLSPKKGTEAARLTPVVAPVLAPHTAGLAVVGGF